MVGGGETKEKPKLQVWFEDFLLGWFSSTKSFITWAVMSELTKLLQSPNFGPRREEGAQRAAVGEMCRETRAPCTAGSLEVSPSQRPGGGDMDPFPGPLTEQGEPHKSHLSAWRAAWLLVG